MQQKITFPQANCRLTTSVGNRPLKVVPTYPNTPDTNPTLTLTREIVDFGVEKHIYFTLDNGTHLAKVEKEEIRQANLLVQLLPNCCPLISGGSK